MKIFEFDKYFPDEETCRKKFKEFRDEQGVVCPKCGCVHHYWISKRGGMYQCAQCGYRQSLRANTIMHSSKLSFRVWFLAMHLLTATKHTFSATEIKKQLGINRFQTVWELLHKLRDAMGKRDGEYTLFGNIEIDEGFLTTEKSEEDKDIVLKRGLGSQAKAKVLVMAESTPTAPTKKSIKPKKVGHIKMVVIPDLKSGTVATVAAEMVSHEAEITSDASKSHSLLSRIFKSYDGRVIDHKDLGKVLPWVHIVIGNARSQLTDTFHGVKREYLQEYLNEYCYKFNRRYYGENLFERLVMITAKYKNGFMHRTYSRAA